MHIPFKKDPTEFNQRTLLATNVFDLLDKDHDCFIYEDIFSQIDTSKVEKKYSMLGQHAYHPRQVTAILIYAYSQISVDKDSQIIVGQHLSQNTNDKKELSPALSEIKKVSLPKIIFLFHFKVS